jgi:hypothetical protein
MVEGPDETQIRRVAEAVAATVQTVSSRIET